MSRRLLVAALAVALSGCVTHEVYVMQNPTTGEIKECRATNTGASLFPIVQANMDNEAARDCAAGYEAAGWKRMNAARKE